MKAQRILLPLLVFILLLNFSCIHRKARREPIHGGCCISQETLVRLSNGKDKLIENLKAGDTVLAYDRAKNKFVSSRVVKMYQTEHAGFVKLNFAALMRNGVSVFPSMSIIVSSDHPIWVKEKGWCSLEPEMTKRIQMMKEVKKLEVNDFCFTNKDSSMEGFAGNAMLASIDKIKEPVRAYSIVQLENKLDCFIANGIVVGTEAMTMEGGGD